VAADLQNARIDLYAANQRLKELERRLGRANQSSEGNARLREQYAGAKAQLDQARLVYTPTHPEVRRLESIVSKLSGQLGPELRGETQAEVSEELREYRTLKANRARLSARVAVLERASGDLKAQEHSKSDAVTEYEQLERELAVDRQMYATLLTRLNQTVLTAVTDNNGTRILDYAVAPVMPISASKPKQLFIVVILAFAAGLGAAVIRELLDRHVHETDDASEVLHAPVLGYIPVVRDRSPAERQSQATNRTIVGEAYRNLRTALLFSVGSSDLSTLVVTSAIAGEGKTTVSSNLAATFAEAGRKVLLVDADLRRPRVNRVFAMQRAPGLSEVIQGVEKLEDAIDRPMGASFDILTSGSIPENPSELLASRDFELVLERMKELYDLVLLDCAVMLAVSDGLLVASRAQGTLIVQRPGTVEKRALEQMKADLDRGHCKVLGIVFNQVDRGNSYVYPSYQSTSRFRRQGSARGGKDAQPRRS
jgi:capsular exopolysaccharide synthesis family protein